MGRPSIKINDLDGVSQEREKKRKRRQARSQAKDRVSTIGTKAFSSMTRAEKDELLFLLALEAGILPKETE